MSKLEQLQKKQMRWLWLFFIPIVLLVWVVLSHQKTPPSAQPAENPFTSIATQVVSQAEARFEHGQSPQMQGPVYLALRSKGSKLADVWVEGSDWQSALVEAESLARQKVAPADQVKVDTLEICLTHGYFEADFYSDRRPFTNIHRGVRGMELKYSNTVKRWSPTQLLAGNISFENALKRFEKSQGLSRNETTSASITMRLFEGEQFLVRTKGKPTVKPMFRGNTMVTTEMVTQESVKTLAQTMTVWMEQQLDSRGRMHYHYFPSRGEQSKNNNMIRQYMASLCLARLLPTEFASQDLEEKLFQNLNYNFQTYYHQNGALGLIEYREKVKLGAVALAALAIWESPFRQQHGRRLDSLTATVAHLHQKTGAFRTFYKPAERNDNQNFYPGEALLYWAIRYKESPDPALLRMFMRSFHYYRAWHQDPKNRNPAFIPWHTQAYYLMWQQTKVPALAEFIFEMNDWVLSLQQSHDLAYEDIEGRFYDPGRPDYGPPHASSTGVYLEGLVDAFALARDQHDEKRKRAYQQAIVKALRSVMQLQFADDVDMYYVSKRKPVKGGLRTTLYDNRIRVDNVQHNLMAILKILDQFEPEDYSP